MAVARFFAAVREVNKSLPRDRQIGGRLAEVADLHAEDHVVGERVADVEVVVVVGDQQPFVVEDLLTGARYTWQGVRNYVRLDPQIQPGHLLRLVRPEGEQHT